MRNQTKTLTLKKAKKLLTRYGCVFKYAQPRPFYKELWEFVYEHPTKGKFIIVFYSKKFLTIRNYYGKNWNDFFQFDERKTLKKRLLEQTIKKAPIMYFK